MVGLLRDRLHDALSNLALRDLEVAQLRARVSQLEANLRREEQHHTNALKDNIVLRTAAAVPKCDYDGRAGVKIGGPGKDLNPRPHAYQACALTLSYQPIRSQHVRNEVTAKAKIPLPHRTVLVRKNVPVP
jgi:hypothetical protein